MLQIGSIAHLLKKQDLEFNKSLSSSIEFFLFTTTVPPHPPPNHHIDMQYLKFLSLLFLTATVVVALPAKRELEIERNFRRVPEVELERNFKREGTYFYRHTHIGFDILTVTIVAVELEENFKREVELEENFRREPELELERNFKREGMFICLYASLSMDAHVYL